MRKRTKSIRLAMDTHERLRHLKHPTEVETLDEEVRALLDRYEKDAEVHRGEVG